MINLILIACLIWNGYLGYENFKKGNFEIIWINALGVAIALFCLAI